MTEKQLEAWKEDAAETLSSIDPNKKTKENFLLAGASLAILNSYGNMTAPECSETPQETSFSPPISYVIDELKDAQKYISAGEIEIAGQELAHARHFLAKAKESAYTPEQQALIKDLQARHELLMQNV